MRKLNIVTLNNVEFTDITKTAKGYILPFEARSIHWAYLNPSARKVAIWEQWDKWARELPDTDPSILACDLWVSTKNSQFFTIGGSILYADNTTANIRITSTKHEYWR